MRCLTIALTLLVFPLALSASPVFYEGFNEPSNWWGSSNPPEGWQIIDDGTADGNDWHQCSCPHTPFSPVASVSYSPVQAPMSDILFKDDIDCTPYENLKLSYWLIVDWYTSYTYYGGFYVYGSNHQFSTHWVTLLGNYWPSNINPGLNLVHDISSWADGQPNVGVWFEIYIDDSCGLSNVYLDSVHIQGDFITNIQPNSLGKLKAMYQ